MGKLVLFDIDRTLILKTKIERTHWAEAFGKVYEVDVNAGDLDNYFGTTSGFTFKGTVFQFLKDHGVSKRKILAKYFDFLKLFLKLYLKNMKKAKVVAALGAEELLRELKRRKVLLGLVTGNLEEIAMAKLTKAGLDKYFKFGGYGDETERAKLVKTAIKKAQEKFGFKFQENVFVVGDTVRDVEVGKKVKVKTVGVATGIYSKRELKKEGADFVLGNLKDKKKFLKIVLG
ncbi:MAG: HAD-IA family hydrolase [Nanoarchaeota archaeon]|nr:HAD-IA family hydrolase [Nanoarchaeota archaeon]MBU1103905.1 HAD-IA family hydrolase [Nanoarchaeota archaeon]